MLSELNKATSKSAVAACKIFQNVNTPYKTIDRSEIEACSKEMQFIRTGIRAGWNLD
jgi:hypothetical protein